MCVGLLTSLSFDKVGVIHGAKQQAVNYNYISDSSMEQNVCKQACI